MSPYLKVEGHNGPLTVFVIPLVRAAPYRRLHVLSDSTRAASSCNHVTQLDGHVTHVGGGGGVQLTTGIAQVLPERPRRAPRIREQLK